MKEFIIQALTEAILKVEKQTPQLKNKLIEVNIEDVSPLNIVEFMKENNIPDDAYFGGRDNGYDAFDQICLCYNIKIPTTDKDKLKFKRDRFSTIVFKIVYDLLLENGYKRIGSSSGLYKEFDNTTVYDMFIANDFDRLVKYYSLSFVLK
jgi:hypothetical protein